MPLDGPDWASLPLEPLEAIFRRLEFKDRLKCALVCHPWNEALFNCPSLVRKIVFSISCSISDPQGLHRVIQDSERNYRQLAIVLQDDKYSAEVDECIRQAAERWRIRFIALVGEPVTVWGCFSRNPALFDSITELNLEFTFKTAWPALSLQEVKLGQLKKLHYLQVYTGFREVKVMFRLVVPLLEEVSVVLDSLANEEAMYWEDPLIELVGCGDRLTSLEIDLNNTMWQSFFTGDMPRLERLSIRRAIDDYEERDWDGHFSHMPGLRTVELTFASNAMLTSLYRHCKQIKQLHFNGFSLDDGSFVDNMNFPALEKLHLDGWSTGSLFSNEPSLRLDRLEELIWKYVELAPAQDIFTLVTPNLGRIYLRGCDYQRFELDVGNRLTSIDMDYYGNQLEAPNFFDSLNQLHQLILHINGPSLPLVNKLPTIRHVRRLELICSTERWGYDCSALFESICNSFGELEEFILRNEHENELCIDYANLVRLEALQQLKVLTLQYVTVRNVTGSLQLKHVPRKNVWGCMFLGRSCFMDGIET